jgi:diaminohydroxyphosphoribosylaminopyrimidine deaminase/5-amino-6-(5-phosphoribosylamino)uracil reductase
MRHALALAKRGLGSVAPNPSVGCVIVSADGRVAGRGWTAPGGRPHAETIALAAAGDRARGATVYVTLEPCAHQGKTPPCAEALVQAGVARVVGALEDPDPRVSGRGYRILEAAGVAVTRDVLSAEAAFLNAGFIKLVTQARPLVTLKIAQSLDGKTATANGVSKWITSEEARRYGHLLRAEHDAIMVGIETALIDDPELTCRIDGLHGRSPLRVVLDTGLRLGASSKLAKTARQIPTLVFTAAEGGGAIGASGVEIERVGSDLKGRLDLREVLAGLGRRGITRLLVEGGATLHASFVDQNFADRIELFTAPILLGDAGYAAVAALKSVSLQETSRYVRTARRTLGPDLLESFALTA